MAAILNTPTRAPVLTATVNVTWEDRKGVERDCDVNVEFTFDGDRAFDMLSAEIVGGGEPYGIDEHLFDALVDDATLDIAHDAYNDWLSDQDDND